jgi:hypothetical protein
VACPLLLTFFTTIIPTCSSLKDHEKDHNFKQDAQSKESNVEWSEALLTIRPLITRKDDDKNCNLHVTPDKSECKQFY